MRARIDRAKLLLATSSLTVTDVCTALGFSSLGSFSHLFRRRCGESPTQFKGRFAGADEASRAAAVAPHCMMLLAAAWAEESYFSRSAPARKPLESRR
jgi:AraC-like DNA-binding protein